MSMKKLQCGIISLFFVAGSSLSFAQTEGAPDPAQQANDQAACQEHAKASSGYDPSSPATTSQPERGAGIRGAARGAAKGAVVGGTVEAVGDDERYDDAAEIGAATGAVAGGARNRRQEKEQAQTAPPAGDPSEYTKSYNDCMKSRGYTVD